MDSAEAPNLLDYYAKHYRPGMVDLSASSAPPCAEIDGSMDYGPPGGLPALREAIAALCPGSCASDVVVTNGASEALAATAFALVQSGQRVSAAEETYPSFREVATRLGAVLTADDASPIVVNNPTIPDGRLVDLSPLLRSLRPQALVWLPTRCISIFDLGPPVRLPRRYRHPPLALVTCRSRLVWAVCGSVGWPAGTKPQSRQLAEASSFLAVAPRSSR